MTLGRTASGAIKIKTDSAGGGLRAVNCECCGGVCDGPILVSVNGNILTAPQIYDAEGNPIPNRQASNCFGTEIEYTERLLCDGSVFYEYGPYSACGGTSITIQFYCTEQGVSFGYPGLSIQHLDLGYSTALECDICTQDLPECFTKTTLDYYGDPQVFLFNTDYTLTMQKQFSRLSLCCNWSNQQPDTTEDITIRFELA